MPDTERTLGLTTIRGMHKGFARARLAEEATLTVTGKWKKSVSVKTDRGTDTITVLGPYAYALWQARRRLDTIPQEPFGSRVSEEQQRKLAEGISAARFTGDSLHTKAPGEHVLAASRYTVWLKNEEGMSVLATVDLPLVEKPNGFKAIRRVIPRLDIDPSTRRVIPPQEPFIA